MFLNIHTHHSLHPDTEVYNHLQEAELKKFFSCGLHPWYVDSDFLTGLKAIEHWSADAGCVAIGECGLDRLKGPDLDIQLQVFRSQAELAERHGLPVIIHCVRAWDELRTLKRTLKPSSPWIWHGFNRPKLIHEVLDEGLYISLGADLIKSEALQRAIEKAPMIRLLLETDESEIPIQEIYQCLAAVKQLPLLTVEEAIYSNIKHIFPKWITGLNELSS